MSTLPVACTLDAGELRRRRAGPLASVSDAVLERRDIAGGRAYRFAASTEVLQELALLIEVERQCCGFLRFRLIVEPAAGPVWLELTGPLGTDEILRDLLG